MEEINGRVTARMLYRAIDDTKEILRSEHEITRAKLNSLEIKIESICKKLNARPAAHWLGNRISATVDRIIPLAIVAFITWILTQGV